MNINFSDLVGLKFGQLTVIKRVEDYISPLGIKKHKYLCKCDCGNEKEILKASLIHGNTKSCGCLRRDFGKNLGESNIIDLTNKRFGRLKVIKRESNKGKRVSWLCKCDCGNEIVVTNNNLLDKRNKTKSCGCLQKELAKELVLEASKKDRFKGTRIGLLNCKKSANNTSGCRGVYRNKRKNKWFAQIQIQSKVEFLGYFKNKEDAIKARKEAEEKYFKPIIEEFKQAKEVQNEII